MGLIASIKYSHKLVKFTDADIEYIKEYSEVTVDEFFVSKGDYVNYSDEIFATNFLGHYVSAECAGIIKKFHIKEGDRLKEGDKIYDIEIDENVDLEAEKRVEKIRLQTIENEYKSEKLKKKTNKVAGGILVLILFYLWGYILNMKSTGILSEIFGVISLFIVTFLIYKVGVMFFEDK